MTSWIPGRASRPAAGDAINIQKRDPVEERIRAEVARQREEERQAEEQRKAQTRAEIFRRAFVDALPKSEAPHTVRYVAALRPDHVGRFVTCRGGREVHLVPQEMNELDAVNAVSVARALSRSGEWDGICGLASPFVPGGGDPDEWLRWIRLAFGNGATSLTHAHHMCRDMAGSWR
jgi:hypothetical protein